LFESGEEHYGEIWYELGGQKIVDRSTIEEVVLEQIYKLAGVNVPERASDDAFPGYPLATQPKHAQALHYLGLIALRARRYDTAAQLIEESIASKREAVATAGR